MLVVLLLAISLGCLDGLSRLHGSLDQIANYNSREARLAGTLRSSILETAVAVRNVVLLTDQAGMTQEAQRVPRQ